MKAIDKMTKEQNDFSASNEFKFSSLNSFSKLFSFSTSLFFSFTLSLSLFNSLYLLLNLISELAFIATTSRLLDLNFFPKSCFKKLQIIEKEKEMTERLSLSD